MNLRQPDAIRTASEINNKMRPASSIQILYLVSRVSFCRLSYKLLNSVSDGHPYRNADFIPRFAEVVDAVVDVCDSVVTVTANHVLSRRP